MNPFLVAFIAVYGVVLVLAIRHRLLGRIALREGIRRPGQTLLVVGGLMIGSAGITAALVATDSANDSAVLNVYRSWDRTDLLVDAGNKVFPSSVATDLAADPALRGHVDGIMGGVEFIGSVSNRTREESDAGVRLVGFDSQGLRTFGAFELASGGSTYGDDLTGGEVLVSRKLADALKVQPGDRLIMVMERAEDPKPDPRDIGHKLKATGNRLKRLQNQVQRKAKAAAARAGKAAAQAYIAQVQAAYLARVAAAMAAYQAKLQALASQIPPAPSPPPSPPPTPPPTPPPVPKPPKIPPPPRIAPPNPAQIQAGAQAAAQAAAAQAAAKVAKRYAPRFRRLGHKLDGLKANLDRAVERLKPVKLTVAGIAIAQGPGAYGLYSAVFAPLPLAQRIAGTDEINTIRVSGTGDAKTGLAAATAALPEVRAAVAKLANDAGVPLEVNQVKKEALDNAKDSTAFTLAMLIGLTFLVIAAGIALIINVIQMLAEERRPRLATLRALGLSRRGLVTLSVLEGALYSLLAASAGVALGVYAGKILAERFALAFAQLVGAEVDFRFVFSVRPLTLVTAFCAGSLITLGTIFFAARRTSHLNIPAAIRNLPEPEHDPRHRRWPRLAANVALFALAVWGLTGSDKMARLLGGVFAIILVARLVRRRLPERLFLSVYGLALVGWSTWNIMQTSQNDDPAQFFTMFVATILVSVVGLALFTSANLRVVERLSAILGPLTRRMRATLRVPLAYLARRRTRTGLTIVMFGVVMAIIALFSVLLFVFQPQYERDSMGYDIIVTNQGKDPVTIPDDLVGQVDKQIDVRAETYVGPLTTEFFSIERTFAPFFELTDPQNQDPPMRLSDKAEEYADDATVWRAVANDPTKVVSDLAGVGKTITLKGTDGDVTFTVIGNPAPGLFTGLTGTPATFAPFEDTARGHALLIGTRPGVNPETFAKDLAKAKYKKGVTVQTTHGLLERGYAATRTFFSIIDVLMKMGLVVGILSLGILALRAIVERRHLIGVLRAVGYQKHSVLSGLLIESAAIATLGVLVGCTVGIGMAWIFYSLFFSEAVFGVLWSSLWGALALVYSATFLVTIGPAWRASRLPPAEAVRYVE